MSEIFGKNRESVPYWEDEAKTYRDHIGSSRADYHRGRLLTASRLLESAALRDGARVLDFGCGDGTFTTTLAAQGYDVVGIDPAAAMIDLARAQSEGEGITWVVGGAESLVEVGACDGVVTLNVLAYLTDEEMGAFWDGVRAIVRPGGVLLISHSNELFDLFALNAGTAEFFARNFTRGEPVASLLAGAQQDRPSYNVRGNPLTYPDELAHEGFEQIGQAFFNLHPLPPSLLGAGDEGRVVNPDEIARVPLWKQQFQCSTFFSLSKRV